MSKSQPSRSYSILRLNAIWILFVVIFAIVCLRLFYLQIIKHDEFLDRANATQIKSLEIEAERGTIYALSNNQRVPLVINEHRWTLFADARFIEDLSAFETALKRVGIDLMPQQSDALASGSRYVALKKGLTAIERQNLTQQLKVKGVYFQRQAIRQYLEGDLASQVVGFLNADSEGQYGIEQFYHRQLTGIPGRLRTTTDVNDVPLLFVEDNILIEPQAGQDITLTLDIPLQRIAETQLKQGVLNTDAKGGTAIVLNADSGAILAMANYPNFDPADYQAADIANYVNPAIEGILEPASVMKVLVMATALNEGAIGIGDNYYNPSVQVVDGLSIKNLNYRGEGFLPVSEILPRSLNTGSVALLKHLGKSGSNETVDLADRQVLADYYQNHFRLTEPTGIGLPNEVSGNFNPPDHPWSPNHLYATMTFGQSVTVTPLQLAAAYAAIFNGGRYYQPYVTAQIGDQVHTPKLLDPEILKPQTIQDVRFLMKIMTEQKYPWLEYDGLEISGKTGSAQVVDFVNGGYIEDTSTGLMSGYIKSKSQTLVVLVIVEEPQIAIAGHFGAQPIWSAIIKGIVSLGRVSR